MVKVKDNTACFNFFRSDAEEMFLVGDFNGWRIGETPMTPLPDGHWETSLRLPPGEYRFRYWAHGRWYTDFSSFGLELGLDGFDSVVRVAECVSAA